MSPGQRPGAKPAGTGPSGAEAFEHGVRHAQEVVDRQRRKKSRLFTKAAPEAFLVAEGDSWFDYPFNDVLEELEDDYGYRVESVAHRGDTVEEMAYDPTQLDNVLRTLKKLATDNREPKAILLSGGGNDIAGHEFQILLNHARSGLPPLNEHVVQGLIDERLRAAIAYLAGTATQFCRSVFNKTIPILIHGYGYPVPDGRGVLGGWWKLPGPWLEPGFRTKGYDDLAHNVDLMVDLMDRFNNTLAALAGQGSLQHVHFVDVRPALSNVLTNDVYQEWWGNELHPTEKGYKAVAKHFHTVLESL